MTPEEYQRIKEAEKEHLRALKKLKEAVRLLERRRSVNQALENMVSGSKDALDVHDEMVEKLALETAQQEARLEIALENAGPEDPSRTAAAPEQTPTPDQEALEEALLTARAQSLLRQIKQEMGSPDDAPPAARSLERPAKPEEAANPTEPAERPEKTIGRMR